LTGARVERRLAAILAADVVGFSALMESDEEGTYSRIGSLRREVIGPQLSEHEGRLIKSTGDGFLAEFASPIAALRCALAIQNTQLADSSALRLRIGLNLGDVIIEEGGDVYGEGVNVAARLEGLADPGGILISGKIHSEVEGKVEAVFEDRGEQQVKNIMRPIRIYAVHLAGATRKSAATIAAIAPLPLPDKPSIAVLPFQNMCGDPEQEYFADGMVEDIITALSRFKSLFVIARNSSFTYKGKALDIKQVGRELGVRYVLEGSVRKAVNRVRITGQLIEAETDRHIWADKFDGGLEDIFDLQDQVTSSVVGLIAPKLEQAEIERAKHKPTERLDSYDFYLRGIELVSTRTLAPLPKALELFKKAFERDPDYAAAYSMAAWTILLQQSISGIPLTDKKRTDAIRLANLGATKGIDDAFALSRSGHVLTYLGHEYDRGASLVEQAVALNPNLANAWHSRGWVSLMCDEYERSIESFDRMIRLSPLDPLRVRAWNGIAFAFFSLSRYEEGFVSANKAIQFLTEAHSMGAYIVNAVRTGHTLEAREAATRLLKLQPDFRASHAQKAFPIRSQETQDRIAAALREAGLPD